MAGEVFDHLRKRLLARRMELGLTQHQGAVFAGFDQGSMSKFERGQLGADIDTLAALASGYGTTLQELLQDAPAKPPNPQWTRLWAAFSTLSVAGRESLLNVLEETARVKARTLQTKPQARRRRVGAAAKAADE